MIKKLLKSFVNHDSNRSLAFQLRKKRAKRIMQLISDYFQKNNEVKIIDVGGTKNYWNIIPKQFLIDHHAQITIVNIPTSHPLPENDDVFQFVYGDGCHLSEFRDRSFHIAHSNSVIEHVGNWANVISFVKELRRVAETCYLQTPSYWFPIEPHFVLPFVHWLPKYLRIKMLQYFGLGTRSKEREYNHARIIIESYNLMTARQLKKLFPNAELFKEKFLLFTKSLIIVDCDH